MYVIAQKYKVNSRSLAILTIERLSMNQQLETYINITKTTISRLKWPMAEMRSVIPYLLIYNYKSKFVLKGNIKDYESIYSNNILFVRNSLCRIQ